MQTIITWNMDGSPVAGPNTKWDALAAFLEKSQPDFVCLQSCADMPYELYQNDLPVNGNAEVTCGYFNYGSKQRPIEYYVAHYQSGDESIAVMARIEAPEREEEDKRAYTLLTPKKGLPPLIGITQLGVTCYSVCFPDHLATAEAEDALHRLVDEANETNLGQWMVGGSFFHNPEELEKSLSKEVYWGLPNMGTFRLQTCDYFVGSLPMMIKSPASQDLVSDHSSVQAEFK